MTMRETIADLTAQLQSVRQELADSQNANERLRQLIVVHLEMLTGKK